MANSDIDWQPLLHGPRAKLATDEVHRIADLIVSSAFVLEDAPLRLRSLGTGCAGWILFLAYAAELLNVDRYRAAAVELADRLKASVGTRPWTVGLLSGLCGIGWLFEHLHRTGLLDLQPLSLRADRCHRLRRGFCTATL